MTPKPIPVLTAEQQERLWKHIDRRGPTECWPWLGGYTQVRPTKSRYGIWHVNNSTHLRPYRVTYTLLRGPIPDGLTLDHVAERCQLGGLCCNPWHLDAVSFGENARRYYRARTHCQRGHEIEQHGRPCRECRNEAKRRERARKKRQHLEIIPTVQVTEQQPPPRPEVRR